MIQSANSKSSQLHTHTHTHTHSLSLSLSLSLYAPHGIKHDDYIRTVNCQSYRHLVFIDTVQRIHNFADEITLLHGDQPAVLYCTCQGLECPDSRQGVSYNVVPYEACS
jgi:hypothetical protein